MTSESSLYQLKRPARYLGGERGSICKDWDRVDVRFAMAFPDTYEVGMSNLGLQILYDAVNRHSDALCERAFAPWPDMEAVMRAQGIPLYALESRRPLSEFDVIGFSLPYELNLTNVLNMLDLAGLPLRREERDARHPLVVAGGPCTANPLPLADFVDAFVVGDGEEAIIDVNRAVKGCAGQARDALLAGGLLVLVADSIVRILPLATELRLGIALSLIGAPFFLWLLVRRDGRGSPG